MFRSKVFLLFLFSALLCFSVELTLDEAIEMASKKNSGIFKAEKDLENYKKQKKEALNAGLPKLSYTGTMTVLGDKTEVDILDGGVGATDSLGNPLYTSSGASVYSGGIPRTIEVDDSDSMYLHKFTLSQPVFVGGKVFAGIRISDKYLEYGNFVFEKEKKDVRLSVMKKYLDILKLEKSKTVLENSLTELQENYSKLEEFYNLGMTTKTSLLELKYTLIELQSTIIQTENGIEISKLDLKNEIGMNAAEDLALVDVVTSVPEASTHNLESDVYTSLDNNLDAKMVKIATVLQEESEVIERADLMPTVAFQLDYGTPQDQNAFKIGDSLKVSEWDWSATIAVSMTLFDWGTEVSEYKRVQNETLKAKENEKTALQGIELAVRSSYLELIRLEKLIEAKNEALVSAKENYKLEKERFEANIISTTDYISAQNRVSQSEVDKISTEIDMYYAYQYYINLLGL